MQAIPLLPVFRTIYDQHADRRGEAFEYLGLVDPDTYDALECGPMHRIRFVRDGAEIDAWPDEVEFDFATYNDQFCKQ